MIYMFLAQGFEETEALCPLDLLRRAGLEVRTVGIGGVRCTVGTTSDGSAGGSGVIITGSHGIPVLADMPDILYRDPRPEMIVLPGGMSGARNLDESPVVGAALDAASKCGAIIGAICAAPMVLGKRGLLAGKRAICYPGFEKYLDGAYLSDRRVVRDGNIITAVGMGVAFGFGLELVRAALGDDAVDSIRASIIADN